MLNFKDGFNLKFNIRHLTLLLLLMVITGCGSQNKFASSFGKRRYTKGFYVDFAAKQKAIHSIALSATNSHEAIREIVGKQEAPRIISNAIDTIVKRPPPVGGERHKFSAELPKEEVKGNEKQEAIHKVLLPPDSVLDSLKDQKAIKTGQTLMWSGISVIINSTLAFYLIANVPAVLITLLGLLGLILIIVGFVMILQREKVPEGYHYQPKPEPIVYHKTPLLLTVIGCLVLAWVAVYIIAALTGSLGGP